MTRSLQAFQVIGPWSFTSAIICEPSPLHTTRSGEDTGGGHWAGAGMALGGHWGGTRRALGWPIRLPSPFGMPASLIRLNCSV